MSTQARPKPIAKKFRPRKSPSVLFLFFVLVSITLISGAAWQLVQDKIVIDKINQRAEQKQEMQEALGWGSELKIDKKNAPLARIRLMLRDKQHKPIIGASVTITLTHQDATGAIIAQNVLTTRLTMVEPGVYRGQTNIPMPGEWNAAIDAQIGANTYQVSERVNLP